MTKTKYHIKMFVTKTNKFRARITKFVPKPMGVFSEGLAYKDQAVEKYEVSIGGESWSMGKGQEHKNVIRRKTEHLLVWLISQYLNGLRGVSTQRLLSVKTVIIDMEKETIETIGSHHV